MSLLEAQVQISEQMPRSLSLSTDTTRSETFKGSGLVKVLAKTKTNMIQKAKREQTFGLLHRRLNSLKNYLP